MNIQELLVLLQEEAERITCLTPGSEWYLFGSILRNPQDAADIDIAVLCSTSEESVIIRHELAALLMAFPIDLFILTSNENAELDFISKQGCVMLNECKESQFISA